MVGETKIDKLIYIKGNPFGIGGGNKCFTLLHNYISAIHFRNFNQKATGEGGILFCSDFDVLQSTVKLFAVRKDLYLYAEYIRLGF